MTPSPELVALMALRIVVTVHPSLGHLVQAIEQDAATVAALQSVQGSLDRAFHPVAKRSAS